MNQNNLVLRLFSLAIVITLGLVVNADAEGKYTVIHDFLNMPASSPESSLVADAAGNLYGAAIFSEPDSCGSAGCGAIFSLTKQSGNKWTYKVIHRFNGTNGWRPVGGLIFDAAGNLYGTTYLGGANGAGEVFELSPSGNTWKAKVLYSFHGIPDVGDPFSALVFDKSGNLYGAAPYGGPKDVGGIFKLSPSGKGWSESVLYTFTGGSDGSGPDGNLAWDSSGNLYSIAGGGGASNQGVVFELSPGNTWKETVLYNFTGGSDGGAPAGGVIIDTKGNLYGTAQVGGISSCNAGSGCGTVFELQPVMGQWQFDLLHEFDLTDGGFPYAVLTMDSAGSLYGTATGGGANNDGAVFKLSQSGGKWDEAVLHSFDGKDGLIPYGGVIVDSQGVICGTTAFGGVGPVLGYGVVFTITP